MNIIPSEAVTINKIKTSCYLRRKPASGMTRDPSKDSRVAKNRSKIVKIAVLDQKC